MKFEFLGCQIEACDIKTLLYTFRQYPLADIISSPRFEHRPDPARLPDEVFGDILRKVHSEWDPSKPLPTPVKFKEEALGWRDSKGNTMLHLVRQNSFTTQLYGCFRPKTTAIRSSQAAWNGDTKLARAIFDSVKARKLTVVQNDAGATPLAMAMIAGQVGLVKTISAYLHMLPTKK